MATQRFAVAAPNARALCAAWPTEQGCFSFLFCYVPRGRSPIVLPLSDATDPATAYGYGGPFGWNASAGDVDSFWAGFTRWAQSPRRF